MNPTAADFAEQEIVYSFTRLSWLGGWWTWALAIILVGAIFFTAYRLYRRDTFELSGPIRVTLILLRGSLFVGLIFFILGLERRARQRTVRPSEVAVLLDTSQSMSLPSGYDGNGMSRIQAVQGLMTESSFLQDIAVNHRVTVYTFDSTGDLNEVIVSSLRQTDAGTDEQPQQVSPASTSALAIAGVVLLLTAALLMIAAAVTQLSGAAIIGGRLLLVSTVGALLGGTLLASQWTVNTQSTLSNLLGRDSLRPSSSPSKDDDVPEDRESSFPQRLANIDWDSILVAAGGESRIGDAIRSTLNRHDPSTLAGIVLLTDGQNNGGTPPVAAAALVARGGTAIYPIGFGSALPPTNVRIVDLDAPRRVYPGDSFAMNAVLQGSGAQPLKVQVQLLDMADTVASTTTGDETISSADNIGEVVDSREVVVPADGTLLGVRFEMEPAAVGKRKLTIRVVPPVGDQNSQDDVRSSRYEVVSRRLRVLLVAGGPMREYQFVRNMLFRDESVEVDVWLQTGQSGMSQDADRLLSEFPSSAAELFEYDAIIAFDPNWLSFELQELELIDKWLSQQAGGMILISGPVYMPEWTRQRTDPRMTLVRSFFPVSLSTRGPLLSAGRTGGDTSWPLEFTSEAQRAEFLSIAEDPQASGALWEQFGGVFDYVGVKDAKPGAKVYAYFMDPSAAIDGALPIYLASQFYGAGRVFFQGSGEMWRLRGVSDAAFDSYYTKLVRWVSEGRLLRDSNRGILLVDRPRAMVGDNIAVRAILTDEQFAPLKVPQVEAFLLTPGGRTETIRLTPLAGEPREGTYAGRLLMREAGAYELRVTLGDALQEQVLRQSIVVGLPTVELERPRRNDEVLSAIAATTGGTYLPQGEDPSRSSGNVIAPSLLATSIEPQSQLTILPGTPDRDFEQRRNASMMWLLCSLLTMEWMVRRFHRLA